MDLSSSLLKVGLCLIIIALQDVQAQNCGVVGTNETVFWAEPTNQNAPPLTLLWSAETYNVVRSVARSHPHFRYIWGLRFEDHYDYVVPDNYTFQDFPETERSDVAERYVTFHCVDGGSKDYTFYFPVIDENTKSPWFNWRHVVISYHEDWPLDQPLQMDVEQLAVFDDDFSLENARVTFRTENDIVHANATLANGDGSQGPIEYHLVLYFTRSPEGQIPTVRLYATDGYYETSIELRFRLYPNPGP